jgi:CheY-like chemotaxis protein
MKLILVVDGHSESRDRLVRTLTTAGYEVLEADSGTKSLQLAHTVRPDLVLLAIVMPESNGLQTAAQLRTVAGYENVPIVVLGWVPPLGINEEPLASLVNGYLSLESSKEELLTLVERKTRKPELADIHKFGTE